MWKRASYLDLPSVDLQQGDAPSQAPKYATKVLESLREYVKEELVEDRAVDLEIFATTIFSPLGLLEHKVSSS